MEVFVFDWWLTSHQSSTHKSLRIFRFFILCFGKIHENPQSNDAWEQRLGWFKTSQEYRNFDRIDGEPMEFEWNIFPGFNTLQLSQEVKSLLLRLGETPKIPTMCEVTWNTWRICERSWCQCMSHHTLKILPFRSLSFLSVSVVVLWLSSLLDARTLWLKFESSFIP